VAKALFLAEPDERPTLAQPVLAGLIAVLAFFTVLTGLFNRPLQAWSDAGPASLGIARENDAR
jgi:hypothetical protein